FWNSWQDIANNPGDPGSARLMLAQAQTVAGTVNGFATQLTQQWTATRQDADNVVANVNALTADVARLNSAIRSATLNGGAPNELADQRDVLVLRIVEATGAVARTMDNGVVDLTLAGRSLVSGLSSEKLQVEGPTSYPTATDTISVTWATTGQPASINGGTLQGQLTALNTSIPGVMSDLDAVAANLAAIVNAQQAAGFDRAGSAGAPIFSGTTAASLTVTLSDPAGVATSSEAPPVLNGSNALAMGAHASDATGPDAQYRDMMISLGVQAQTIQRSTDTQKAVSSRVDAARESVSGVSLDEEMANLVAFQHAYSAAAKYISAIDSTLDTLINIVK
ncbi:MAG TPA: flagellar hook-associated protein FlgK, partial [Dermatophilaceae bacterium]